jgi:hypothetical protein
MTIAGIRDAFPLAEAAPLMPVPDPPSIKLLQRWATTGVRGTVLKTIVCGGKRYTTREFVEEFLQAQNPELAHA